MEPTREADLPALAPRAEAPARFSFAHGDQERPQDRGPPPPARAQAPDRLRSIGSRAPPVRGDRSQGRAPQETGGFSSRRQSLSLRPWSRGRSGQGPARRDAPGSRRLHRHAPNRRRGRSEPLQAPPARGCPPHAASLWAGRVRLCVPRPRGNGEAPMAGPGGRHEKRPAKARGRHRRRPRLVKSSIQAGDPPQKDA